MSDLVIVESPAKAKTIKKYLGAGYDVQASMGHVRDLPSNAINVDIKNNFKPKYEILKGKEDIVKKLKAKAKKSDKIYLATDPDREGEAISWHLAYILNLSEEEQNRVVFNEITPTGVKKGMDSPKKIDLDLVDAQQARRILDRIVGYKLSPFLWSKIRKGLSAGRVQSVAVRIVVDREEEIENFVPEESFTIDAKFENPKDKRNKFFASLYGDKNGKIELNNRQEADNILKKLENATYTINSLKRSPRKKSPVPPFITSTLQQEASRRLSMRPRQTMMIAQQLYEGIEVEGIGAVGLITYMRTDSLRISDDAIKEAREYIQNKYSDDYLPAKPKRYKSGKNAQDAHEAIRPTMPSLTPDRVKANLSRDQFRLYKLIWERFMASNMSDCIQDTIKAEIIGNDLIFRASGYKVAFDGFTILYQEEKEEQKKDTSLFKLEKGNKVIAQEIIPNQHFTQPPPRYTEATLIKAMEKNGIGRPSTYATAITTIINREYVERERKILKPTELGCLTTKLMKERFPKIVDIKFTADMESSLDAVEEGKENWEKVLDDFYTDFNETLKTAKAEMKGIKLQLESEKIDMTCELCGKPMVIRHGKYGKFIGCTGYPECKNIKRLNDDGTIMSEEEMEKEMDTGIVCDKCGKPMVVKQGKYGKFLGCTGYPECKNIKQLKPDGTVMSKEEEEQQNHTDEICDKCGRPMVVKQGRYGKFLACSGYPECKNIKKLGKDGKAAKKEEPVVTDEICPNCGKPMVIKKGRYGEFLACSGYPKCKTIKSLKKKKDDK